MVKERIVIVGGGYGGLRAVERLAKCDGLEITLIDKQPFHYFQTEAYRFVSGRLNTCDVTYDLRAFCSYFDTVTFIRDQVIAIEAGYIRGKLAIYPFDRLIIAVGTRDFIPESFRPYAYGIKDIRSAYAFKQAFLAMLFERTTQGKAKKHIVIGGAGQSGVELAADLMSISNGCGNSSGYDNGIAVTLIEGSEQILPGASTRLQQDARKRLELLGVTIRTGDFIESIEESVMYVGGERIPYDLFLFSGGVAPYPWLKESFLPTNEREFVLVDQQLRAAPNIFVIGDAAYITDEKGRVLPPTAQLAEQCAEYVAKVIASGEHTPFRGRIYGMFTALGYRYGVGELFGRFYFKGRIAYVLKALITQLYAWGIKTKVNSAYFKRKNV